MDSLAEELTRQAWAAEQRGNLAAAWALWLEVAEGPDGNAAAFSRAAQVRMQQKEYDAADAVTAAGLARFPGHPELLANHAWSAHHRAAWPEALRRWGVYQAATGDAPFPYAIRGVALVAMGRFAEADEVYRDGLSRFPQHLELLGNYAWSAQRRGAWEEALERWQAAHAFHPGNPVPLPNIQLALEHLGRIEEAGAIAARIAAPDLSNPGLADLLMRFESLGGDCHFGIVQDRFGARPLGLLRFTATPVASLVRALEMRLEGIGDPQNTDVVVSEFDEYLTSDNRFHMVMHTYVKRESAPDIEKQSAKFLQRLRFLRRKMLEDLAAAEKIFVYASRAPYRESDAFGLWRQLRSYGDNRLLFVVEATDANPPGTVVALNDSLAIGHAAHFDNEAPALADWLRLCQQAAATMPAAAKAEAPSTEFAPAES